VGEIGGIPDAYRSDGLVIDTLMSEPWVAEPAVLDGLEQRIRHHVEQAGPLVTSVVAPSGWTSAAGSEVYAHLIMAFGWGLSSYAVNTLIRLETQFDEVKGGVFVIEGLDRLLDLGYDGLGTLEAIRRHVSDGDNRVTVIGACSASAPAALTRLVPDLVRRMRVVRTRDLEGDEVAELFVEMATKAGFTVAADTAAAAATTFSTASAAGSFCNARLAEAVFERTRAAHAVAGRTDREITADDIAATGVGSLATVAVRPKDEVQPRTRQPVRAHDRVPRLRGRRAGRHLPAPRPAGRCRRGRGRRRDAAEAAGPHPP
jgi:hypothetical protein